MIPQRASFSVVSCDGVPSRRVPGPDGDAPAVSLYWLGQAGFVIDTPAARLVIDPYLSDSLAEKYRGGKFPHEREMPAPIAPGELLDVDWVLSTHAHTDHLDPGTLPALAAANPGCRFLIPRSARATAIDRGVPPDRIVTCAAEDTVTLAPGTTDASVAVVPAAHEERARDENGDDVFLGYVIELSGLCIYHSGDTVPFAALDRALERHSIDLALLPVNGRDAYRRSNGVPGNMTLDEAIALVKHHRIGAMIGHHFGMFAFNTIDPAWGAARIAEIAPDASDRIVLARTGVRYELRRADPGD